MNPSLNNSARAAYLREGEEVIMHAEQVLAALHDGNEG